MCAYFPWKTEVKQATTWQRITAHTKGEAVNTSVHTGQTGAPGAGHPAGSYQSFVQAALQLEPCLRGSSWKLALVLLAPRQGQCRDARPALPRLCILSVAELLPALAHPGKLVMRRASLLLPGTRLAWLQGWVPHREPAEPLLLGCLQPAVEVG